MYMPWLMKNALKTNKYVIHFSDVDLLSILDSTSYVAETLNVDAEPPSIASRHPAPTHNPSDGGNVIVKSEEVKATNQLQLLICPISGNQVSISSKILL